MTGRFLLERMLSVSLKDMMEIQGSSSYSPEESVRLRGWSLILKSAEDHTSGDPVLAMISEEDLVSSFPKNRKAVSVSMIINIITVKILLQE